jgi:non-heme chloroperoxidase
MTKTAAAGASTITDREREQIERANATGLAPVVFIHGLWLLASSWERWAERFEAAGYAPVLPGWPDDPETVADAKARPEAFAGKTLGEVADHMAAVIGALERKPAVVGHSFGGLLTMIVAGRGLAAVSVAISPAPFRGVLPVPLPALRSGAPVLRNPANLRRSVTLSWEEFRYGWANALGEAEGRALYETYHVAGSGVPIFQAVAANLNPWSDARVDTRNPERGPLLVIGGEEDHTIPWAIAHAAYKLQKRNPGVTELVKVPHRGHSLTIDAGAGEVADIALGFVQRFL